MKISSILKNKYFERFIYFFIIISCFSLTLSDPFSSSNSIEAKSYFFLEILVNLIYLIEVLMKIISNGLIFNGKDSYLRNYWNILDFLILIITTIGIFGENINFIKEQNIKSLRALRLFLIIKFHNGLMITIQTFFNSIRDIIKLILFYSICLLFFGSLATKYFGIGFFYCDLYNNHIIQKTNCFDFGGNWLKKDISYENIIAATKSLFQISSTEGWSYLM